MKQQVDTRASGRQGASVDGWRMGRWSIAWIAMAYIMRGGWPIAVAAQEAKAIAAHDEYVYSIVYSADGRLFVTASGDNTAVIWDAKTHERRQTLRHEAAVYSVDVAPDGETVVTGSGAGVVAMWQTRDGTRLVERQTHADAVYCVAFAPNGTSVVSAGGSTEGGDTVVRLLSAQDLHVIREYRGHERQVYGAMFSGDGRWIVTGSSDKSVRIWDVESGEFRQLQGHTSDVYRCVFSQDGEWVVSASQDGTVRVWSVKTGGLLQTLRVPGTAVFYSAVITPNSDHVLAVSADRRLVVWRARDWQLISSDRIARGALYAIDAGPGQSEWSVGGEDGAVYVIEKAFP